MPVVDRLKHAWNAFSNNENDPIHRRGPDTSYGTSYSIGGRPDRGRPFTGNERSIITAIYNQIAVDAASIPIRHVRVDEERRYLEDIKSGLDRCLTVEANIDEAGRQFRQNVVQTLIEEGLIAVVPVDTDVSPISQGGGIDIRTMRIGRITMWHPQHVRVSVYNDQTGSREEITLPKKSIAIIENPFYNIMNEPSSTLQRLLRKLNMLDTTDDKVASGKLDMIVQLPYAIKSENQRMKAQQRRAELEHQLEGAAYGVAYIDAAEQVTQLNRPVENNLLAQVEMLLETLYSQLGITKEIMNGTADEATMKNYYARVIEPLLDAVVEGMIRTFITKTAYTQGQDIKYFRDPFKLVPIGGDGGIADSIDKLARNEVIASNEGRQFLGMKPSKDPKADQLINSNMPQADTGVAVDEDPESDALDSDLDGIDKELEDLLAGAP